MRCKAVLIDIDGTLFLGNNPIAGASATLRYLRNSHIRYRFLSNGTRKSRYQVLEKLAKLGLPISAEEVLTPSVAAIRYLKKRGIRRCRLLVTGTVADDFVQEGFTLTDDAPVIVIGDAGDNFSYSAMNAIFRQIMEGAEVLALEKDKFWMDTDGLSLAAGPFITALEYSSGCIAHLVGKPAPDFFQSALASLDLGADSVMMIGDDILTDIGGGQAAGLFSVLVRTGKFREDTLEQSEIVPDTLIPSIQDLPALLESLREAC